MNALRPTSTLFAATLVMLLSAAAHATDKTRQPGTTVHGGAQPAVHPLGNHLRVIKPIGNGRKPPKTILTKRPS